MTPNYSLGQPVTFIAYRNSDGYQISTGVIDEISYWLNRKEWRYDIMPNEHNRRIESVWESDIYETFDNALVIASKSQARFEAKKQAVLDTQKALAELQKDGRL